MPRLAALALALAAVAVGVLLLENRRDPEAVQPAAPSLAPLGEERSLAPPPEAARPAARATAREALETPRAPENAAAPKEAGAIVGRVLRRSGRSPVPGAPVRAGVVRDRGGTETLVGTAAEDGSFRLVVGDRATLTWVEALSTATSAGSGRVFRRERVSPGRDARIELLVGAGASVSGVVVDGADQPVPGALVRLWNEQRFVDERGPAHQEVLSAFDGVFEFRHVGPEFLIEAGTDALVCVKGVMGRVIDGARVEDVVVEVGEPWTIEVRIVDEADRAIADALVSGSRSFGDDSTGRPACERFEPELRNTRSDERGSLTLGPLASASAVSLYVSHPDFLPGEAWVPPHQEQPVTIRLSAGVCCGGIVLDREGRALAGARVGVWVPHQARNFTKTDAQGRFRVCGLPSSGEGILMVHAPGQAIHVEQPFSIGAEVSQHIVRLDEGLPLAGRVVDAEGRAVEDAAVLVVGERSLSIPTIVFGVTTTWEWALGIDSARTDVAGAFSFEDLYPGTFAVRAASPEAPEVVYEVRADAGEADVLVRLDPELRSDVALVGSVVDGVGGAPLPAFELTVMEERGNGMTGRIHPFEDGAYRIAGLEPGEKQLVFSATGFARLSLPRRELAVGEHRFDVRLLPLRNVELRLVDLAGRPLQATTQVRFRDLRGETLELTQGPGSWGPWAQVRDDGRVTASGLPADVVRVVVFLDEGGEEDVEVELDLDLRQPVGGPLELRLDRLVPADPGD